MARPIVKQTGKERFFPENEIIVSKTDLKGTITYANKLFLDIADYSLADVMKQPHNMIRSPSMPRSVFKFMWERIQAGHEIFAYVVNNAKNGDHYWVLAHVTPSLDSNGRVQGYHSNRRVPRRDAVSAVQGLYNQLLKLEENGSPKEGLAASEAMLHDFLKQKGVDYDRFIHSL